MTRVIKFRARNDELKGWMYWTLPTGEFPQLDEIANDLFFATANLKTRGEFTGLLDKNGKEIYEGDIGRDSEGCGFVVRWSNDTLQWLGEYPGVDAENLVDIPDPEVIGNIYENSNLLKG